MAHFLLIIGPLYIVALAILLLWVFGWCETFLPFSRNLHFRYISGIILTGFAMLMPAAFFLTDGKVRMFFRRVGYMSVVIIMYLAMLIFAASILLWILRLIVGLIRPDSIYREVTNKKGEVKRVKRPLWGVWSYRILGLC